MSVWAGSSGGLTVGGNYPTVYDATYTIPSGFFGVGIVGTSAARTLTAASGSFAAGAPPSLWVGSSAAVVVVTDATGADTYISTYVALYGNGGLAGAFVATGSGAISGGSAALVVTKGSGSFPAAVSSPWVGSKATLTVVGNSGSVGGAAVVITLPTPTTIASLPQQDIVVHLRDWTGVRVAQIDDIVKLQFVVRHQDVGSWVLDLHPDAAAAAVLRETLNAGVVRHAGIEVVRGGNLILSGPVTQIEGSRKGMTERVTLSGSDDTVWLGRREAKPQPATAAPPYSTDAYDVRTGVGSSVLIGYVNANLGPGALVARRVPGLVMAPDPLVGSNVTGQGRYQPVLELVQGLAVAAGDLGFRIISTGGGGLQFQVYQPVDRSATVKFSQALGNLGDYDYKMTAPAGNYGIGGGSGELTARTIVEEGDSASIATWGLSEFFRDRRDTTDTTQITQSLDEELTKRAATRAVTITPIDMPQVAFGVHYGLGDLVTAVVDDLQIVEVVREVKITYSAAGQIVEPTLASPGSGPPSLPTFFHDTTRTKTRVVDLERR